MSMARVALGPDGVTGFIKTLEAHAIAPWDSHLRRQVTLSLIAAMRSQNVRIEPDAAGRAFEIGRSSSPFWVGVLACEAEYLVNAGRHEEAEPILAYLREHARLQSATWLLDATLAARTGDAQRLVHSVNTGTRLRFVPEDHREQYARLRALLEVQ